MLISTRELEQMLPVDVRVQIKALGPQGWVPCSPLAYHVVPVSSHQNPLRTRIMMTLQAVLRFDY